MEEHSQFPKGKVRKVIGRCLILKGNDIDTDRIIPARFLKCVSFDKLGSQVFADDREEKSGLHPFDLEINQGASILIVNKNFGCGSSREHAPQALMRWGIRAVIGESFAEIFHGNCLSIGIPCVTLLEKDLTHLIKKLENNPREIFLVDLELKCLKSNILSRSFMIEETAASMLQSGNWDDTSKLISQADKIDKVKASLPYLNNFNCS